MTIEGEKFLIDGKPTYSDVPNVNPKALGMLLNSRMVQALFDDENPETRHLWRYPDGSEFDPRGTLTSLSLRCHTTRLMASSLSQSTCSVAVQRQVSSQQTNLGMSAVSIPTVHSSHLGLPVSNGFWMLPRSIGWL